MQHPSPHDTHLEDTVQSTKIHQKLGIIRVHLEPKKVISIISRVIPGLSVIAKAIVLAQWLIFVKPYLNLGNSPGLGVELCLPPPRVICWSPVPPLLRTWPYLEMVLYRGSQGKVGSLGWMGPNTAWLVFLWEGEFWIMIHIEDDWKKRREKIDICMSRRGEQILFQPSSEGVSSVNTLILDSQPSEPWGKSLDRWSQLVWGARWWQPQYSNTPKPWNPGSSNPVLISGDTSPCHWCWSHIQFTTTYRLLKPYMIPWEILATGDSRSVGLGWCPRICISSKSEVLLLLPVCSSHFQEPWV